MSLLKYLLYVILLLVFSLGLLLLGANAIYYMFNSIRNIWLLMIAVFLSFAILIGGITYVGMFLGKYISILNNYGNVGLKISGLLLAVLSVLFLIINFMNINFEYTRGYFMFILYIILSVYTPISFFAYKRGDN